MNRREIKRKARENLKKHYLLFVVLCLLAGLIGTNYYDDFTLFVARNDSPSAKVMETGTTEVPLFSGSLYKNLIQGDFTDVQKSQKKLEKEKQKSKKVGRIEMSHQEGILSKVINEVSSGAIFTTVYVTIGRISGSSDFAKNVIVAFTGLVYLLFVIFVVNTFSVIYKRLFLEGITYQDIPIYRMFYLWRVKCYLRVSLSLLVLSLYQLLWGLTIIGGVIKYYSYYLVPYILAENPHLTPHQAITLSRHMMLGHKWEVFIIDVSLIGWKILGIVTLGVSNLLFTNVYGECIQAEIYKEIRQKCQEEGKDVAVLNDTYLFTKPEDSLLKEIYAPMIQNLNHEAVQENFWQSFFGVVWCNDQHEHEYRQAKMNEAKYKGIKKIIEGKCYPLKLHPLNREKTLPSLFNLQYLRHYSVLSLVYIFFFLSILGWVWEVSLHLLTEGDLVNRGFLHGPWLPIYGIGSIMMLVLLNKVREYPLRHFICSIILSGFLEYYTSLLLEVMNHGQRWWNYSGYFLNIDGRISAEGLLFFGLGGLIVVYFIAPMLDNLVNSYSRRILRFFAVLLIVIYLMDCFYSYQHPNTGKGVVSEHVYGERGNVKC